MALRQNAWVAALFALAACGTQGSGSDADDANTRQFLNGSALGLGDPCRPEDGWQLEPIQPSPEEMARIDQGQPVAVSAPAGWKSQPAVGDPFCLRSDAYPGGYFSIVCRKDGDCPSGGTYCEQGFCMAECTSDSDCRSPMRCSGINRKACVCLECLAPWSGSRRLRGAP